jgi:hypothetical protein
VRLGDCPAGEFNDYLKCYMEKHARKTENEKQISEMSSYVRLGVYWEHTKRINSISSISDMKSSV